MAEKKSAEDGESVGGCYCLACKGTLNRVENWSFLDEATGEIVKGELWFCPNCDAKQDYQNGIFIPYAGMEWARNYYEKKLGIHNDSK